MGSDSVPTAIKKYTPHQIRDIEEVLDALESGYADPKKDFNVYDLATKLSLLSSGEAKNLKEILANNPEANLTPEEYAKERQAAKDIFTTEDPMRARTAALARKVPLKKPAPEPPDLLEGDIPEEYGPLADRAKKILEGIDAMDYIPQNGFDESRDPYVRMGLNELLQSLKNQQTLTPTPEQIADRKKIQRIRAKREGIAASDPQQVVDAAEAERKTKEFQAQQVADAENKARLRQKGLERTTDISDKLPGILGQLRTRAEPMTKDQMLAALDGLLEDYEPEAAVEAKRWERQKNIRPKYSATPPAENLIGRRTLREKAEVHHPTMRVRREIQDQRDRDQLLYESKKRHATGEENAAVVDLLSSLLPDADKDVLVSLMNSSRGEYTGPKPTATPKINMPVEVPKKAPAEPAPKEPAPQEDAPSAPPKEEKPKKSPEKKKVEKSEPRIPTWAELKKMAEEGCVQQDPAKSYEQVADEADTDGKVLYPDKDNEIGETQ